MAFGIPSTNAIGIPYTDAPETKTKFGYPVQLSGSGYIGVPITGGNSVLQAGPNYNTATATNSLIYSATTGAGITGNAAPSIATNPIPAAGGLYIPPGALNYGGTATIANTQGGLMRLKAWGTYAGPTTTPTLTMEVGLITNTSAYTYNKIGTTAAISAISASSAAWRLEADIMVVGYGATSGVGSGFAGTANVTGGVITSITITNGGSGYINPPTLAVAGATNAVLLPVLQNGAVVDVKVIYGGSGYSQGAAATATAVGGNLYVNGVAIINGATQPTNMITNNAGISALTSLDTTLGYWLDIRAAMSVSAAGNTVQLLGAYLEFLN